MSIDWAFYDIPIENYALSKISDSLLKNPSNHLIRHWTGDSPRKNFRIVRYSANLRLKNELWLSILRNSYRKLCNFKDLWFSPQKFLDSFNSSLNRRQSQGKLLNSTVFYNPCPLKWALVEHSTKFLSKVMQFQRFVILSSKIPRLI